jgi:hypothetical protein
MYFSGLFHQRVAKNVVTTIHGKDMNIDTNFHEMKSSKYDKSTSTSEICKLMKALRFISKNSHHNHFMVARNACTFGTIFPNAAWVPERVEFYVRTRRKSARTKTPIRREKKIDATNCTINTPSRFYPPWWRICLRATCRHGEVLAAWPTARRDFYGCGSTGITVCVMAVLTARR